jgi:copper(I)-binding protein
MITRVHRWRRLLAVAALALVSAQARAVFVVAEPWLRPAPAAQATEAYMRLMSSDGATLIGVRSPIAGSVALLGTGGKRTSPMALPLPAGDTVVLAPGKFRIQLGKLSRTLRVGDRVPLTLVVREVTGAPLEIDIDAEVRLRSATDDHLRPHTHAARRDQVL